MADHPTDHGPGPHTAPEPPRPPHAAGVAASPTPAPRPRARWRYAGAIASRLRRAELLRARWTLLAALGAFAIGGFVKLTTELNDGELEAFDRSVLSAVIEMRVARWNGSAVDLTALGSVTVLTLIVIIAGIMFLLVRDRQSLAQLLVAALGGSIGSTLLKRVLERQRPDELTRLVEVSSFSYPSGHSLASASIYLTLAILVSRRMKTTAASAVVLVIAIALAAAIGFSRAYLGVHYPSDIAAGFLLGAGWALLVSSMFSFLRASARVRMQRRQGDTAGS
jgi:undecaprenyl-diphosphatase